MACEVCCDLKREVAVRKNRNSSVKSKPFPHIHDHYHSAYLTARGRILVSETYHALLKSKGRGCQICYAIFRGLEIFTEDIRAGKGVNEYLRGLNPPSYYFRFMIPDGGPLEVSAFVCAPRSVKDATGLSTRLNTMTICYEVFTDQHAASPPPIPGVGPARNVAAKPGTDLRVRLIKEWMNDCQENHSTCRPWARKDFLPIPRRFLDLSGKPRSRMRLVDSIDTDQSHDYAIVSHPWHPGDDPGGIPRLTTQNCASLRNEIRWADLPAAWKDAVAVASEQGIRYLWIDALCILQDDVVDFSWHIEHMFAIYRGAALNISLARLSDVGASCLGPRKFPGHSEVEGTELGPEDMKTHEIVLSHKKQRFSVYVRRALCVSHRDAGYLRACGGVNVWSHVQETLRNNDRLAPLLSSAWAFAQALISPRTVHFHASEMIWECYECAKCECRVLATPMRQLSSGTLDRRWPPHVTISSLMNRYPRLRMPDDRHRLHALAAVLERLTWRYKQDCYAGLFANTRTELASALLWVVQKSEKEENRSRRHKFRKFLPSWSWVSMELDGKDRIGCFRKQCLLRDTVFITDPQFRVQVIDRRSLVRRQGPTALSADSWSMSVRGLLMLGKISPKFRSLRCNSFVPSSGPLLDYYIPSPPELPPPPPPIWARPQQPPGGQDGAIHEAGPPVPPHVPTPPAANNSTGAPTPRPPRPHHPPPHVLSMRSLRPPRPLPPFLENGMSPDTPVFKWDCDDWAEQARGAGKEPIYAYFLRLGSVCNEEYAEQLGLPVDQDGADEEAASVVEIPPQADPYYLWDVGLVLRRTPSAAATEGEDRAGGGGGGGGDAAQSHEGRCTPNVASLERIGFFMVSRLKDFFGNAQVQDVTIV